MHNPSPRLLLTIIVLAALLPRLVSADDAPPSARPAPASPFGMNLYITGLERPRADLKRVAASATDLGVGWSREELSWANIEPQEGRFNFSVYDDRLAMLQQQGIGVVGMLLTTPSWASGVEQTQPGWYWYPPTDPATYGRYVEATVNHWKDRVAVWELWNEPDKAGTWQPQPNPAAYAALLWQGYQAVKRADPTALAMVGSVYVHDRNNEGLAFLNQVVAASNGQLNFDILGVHTFMTDRQPEDVARDNPVQNLPYRITVAREWLAAHGGANKPVWVTEDGESTCANCGGNGVSPQVQAWRLPRQYVLAIANGAGKFFYFQLKDKFNNPPSDLFGNMAIIDNNWQPKPAYYAYKAMTAALDGATFVGGGPLLRQQPDRWQPAYDRYEYIFRRGDSIIHVLWQREDVPPATANVNLSLPSVRVLATDGSTIPTTPQGGSVRISLSAAPIYVIEQPNPLPDGTSLDPATDPTSPTGLRVSSRFQGFWAKYGGLPVFGYAISGERYEQSPTDGKQYTVQWFERARFEWHPEFLGSDNSVELGLLGRQVTAGRNFPTVAPFQSTAAAWYFAPTSHSLSGRFLQYWQASGGLTLYGYPISEPLTEASTDGKGYTVQYFERARFEYHPENRPPYDVLLGLLGRQLYKP